MTKKKQESLTDFMVIDEDELEYLNYGHIGLMPNGGDEYECHCCGELVYPI